MIVVLKPGTPKEKIQEVIEEVVKLGYTPHPIHGELQTVVAAIGDERTHLTLESLTVLPQVERVLPVQKRYKLVSRESRGEDTIVNVDGIRIGGGHFAIMAGPCNEGLRLLRAARKETGLKIITEVLSERDVELVSGTADILQIGARNAQNFQLLIECARSKKPVLLKRGMSERIEEWLLAAEYLLAKGNPNVLLCERGIRTFETYTRNTLDLAAVAIAKKESHLPVIVDPSQGCGRADLVKVLCRGAAAIGADGLLVEVHPNPAEALSDGQQQVDFDVFRQLVTELLPFLNAAERKLV
jgi:3-deoxy-7-phosphoheptulonate synthase